MNSHVSIVMTVYNRERYLSAAIESVLTQTYSNFEFIIWDDGSEDDSIAIAQHYAEQDKRIKFIKAAHKGLTPARKSAVESTNGMYVGWVDSDDLLGQTALEETVSILEQNPTVGVVYTDYLVINENNSIREYGQRCRIPYTKERLLLSFMTFHFRLLRRTVYNQIGGIDRSFLRCQDYDLCLKLSEVTDIFHLEKPLYYYRHHVGSISCQEQFEQIYWSKIAVEKALQRRNMTEDYELEVGVFARFSLLKK